MASGKIISFMHMRWSVSDYAYCEIDQDVNISMHLIYNYHVVKVIVYILQDIQEVTILCIRYLTIVYLR